VLNSFTPHRRALEGSDKLYYSDGHQDVHNACAWPLNSTKCLKLDEGLMYAQLARAVRV